MRRLLVVGAVLVGLVATAVGVGRVRATAAPTGWSYGVQLATPTGTFTMQHITGVELEGHARKVADSMTTTGLNKAKSALGATPVYRLHITKTFGDVERANDVASLTGTVLPRVGFYVYNNGVLVDHLRLAPAWVTYVHQSTPAAGGAAIQETMEFSAPKVERLVTQASVPVVPPKPVTNGLDGSATLQDAGGISQSWDQVANVSDQDGKEAEGNLTPDQQTQAGADLGGDPSSSVILERPWEQGDNAKLSLGKDYNTVVKQLKVKTTRYINGTGSLYLERSVDKGLVNQITLIYPKPGSTGRIMVKFGVVTNAVKQTYVSPTA